MKTIKHTVGKKAYRAQDTAAHISRKSGSAIKDSQMISVKTGIAEGSHAINRDPHKRLKIRKFGS